MCETFGPDDLEETGIYGDRAPYKFKTPEQLTPDEIERANSELTLAEEDDLNELPRRSSNPYHPDNMGINNELGPEDIRPLE